MTTHLNTLLVFINNNPELTYSLIFLISLSESLALVGLLVPGTVIMFGIGAIVATGSLSLFPVLLMAITGAIAGDGISYRMGHHYKERLNNIWPFSHHPGILSKGETFFNRHGGKGVLFGRFVGPVRPVIPVVAGMMGMQPVRFTIVNILSAVGWALVYILPGVFFGASLTLAGTISTRLAILVLIFVAGVWSLIWISRKTLYLLDRKGPIVFAALKKWTTNNSPNQQTLVRPFKRLLAFLIFREQGEEMLFAFLTLLLFATGWGFLGVLQDVLAKDPLTAADQAVFHFLQSLRTPWADNVFAAVTELGDSFVNISLFCTILFILLVKHCYRAGIFWSLTVIGGLMGVQVLKWTIHLPRPLSIYEGASAFSFPSGHTTMSVVVYGFLAILIVRQIGNAWRWGLVSSVVLIAFVIGFSRLYLGAHWLSDVLGGYFIGTSWVTITGIAYLKKVDTVPKYLLIGTALGITVIAGGWHVSQQHKKDLSFYASRNTTQPIPLASWMSEGWRNLPTYRIDMAGEMEQPLIIQLTGTADNLTQYLLSKQWQTPSPANLKNILRMLSPDTPVAELPVLPLLHNGRVDMIQLVQPIDETHRWVLRLWPTDLKIAENKFTVFEGTIEVQNRRQIADLILIATDSGNYDLPLTKLAELLNGQFTIKLVNRNGNKIMNKNQEHKVNWHGGVLLISQGNQAAR